MGQMCAMMQSDLSEQHMAAVLAECRPRPALQDSVNIVEI